MNVIFRSQSSTPGTCTLFGENYQYQKVFLILNGTNDHIYCV